MILRVMATGWSFWRCSFREINDRTVEETLNQESVAYFWPLISTVFGFVVTIAGEVAASFRKVSISKTDPRREVHVSAFYSNLKSSRLPASTVLTD